MKRRLTFIAVLIIFVSFTIEAQYKPKSSRQSKSSYNKSEGFSFDRLYFGGGGGFSGGTDFINLSVSPLIGYKITEQFSAGLQITYQYVKIIDTRINNYGGGPFLRYNFSDKLFGYTEYEYLNFGFQTRGEIQRESFNSWFAGIGYSEAVGDKAAVNILVLYNLLYSDGGNSPYQSPLVIRGGLTFGL